MRHTCVFSILLVAVGCGGTQVRNVTGPGGNPAYAISCHQDRGLCYKEAYNTCQGGYYILDAAAVNRGDTGRHETINQDRPGRASQGHSLLVQCTGDGVVDPLLADVGTDRGRYPYARYAAPATPKQAVTVRDPLLWQLGGSTQVRHAPTVLPPADMSKRVRKYTYGGDPYSKDASGLDVYNTGGGHVAPYSESAVPPYPGYKGYKYSRTWRRKKSRRKRKAKKAKAAPAAADCACP